LSTTINLAGTYPGQPINYAFVVPRDGTLTSLYALFSYMYSSSLIAENEYYIHAVLYRSQSPTSNLFDQLAATDVTLNPALVNPVEGDVATGSATFNIAVTAGDRLLLVFYIEPPEGSTPVSIVGYASAGLAIS
jgi:BclB C-terminal domain-containing protein